MQRRRRVRTAAIATAACAAIAAAPASADDAAADAYSGAAAITGYGQFNTNLDSGGRFNWGGGIASASLGRSFTPQFSTELQLRYEYQSWNFNSPTAFGGVAPWKNFNAPSIGVAFNYAYSQDLFFNVTPVVQWSYEQGADTGQSLNYGAVALASKVFSPDLVLGLGVGVFRRIDKTQALPFLVVNWKINDKWRVNNPFQAGPVGGAGLEVVYAPDDRWEFAQGLSYRSYRFRLASDAPTANGIGENSFIPLFLRVTRKLSKELRLDFYGAIETGGKLSVDNSDGSGRYSDNYKTAPALGATLSYKY
jgi:hypothetical protein